MHGCWQLWTWLEAEGQRPRFRPDALRKAPAWALCPKGDAARRRCPHMQTLLSSHFQPKHTGRERSAEGLAQTPRERRTPCSLQDTVTPGPSEDAVPPPACTLPHLRRLREAGLGLCPNTNVAPHEVRGAHTPSHGGRAGVPLESVPPAGGHGSRAAGGHLGSGLLSPPAAEAPGLGRPPSPQEPTLGPRAQDTSRTERGGVVGRGSRTHTPRAASGGIHTQCGRCRRGSFTPHEKGNTSDSKQHHLLSQSVKMYFFICSESESCWGSLGCHKLSERSSELQPRGSLSCSEQKITEAPLQISQQQDDIFSG